MTTHALERPDPLPLRYRLVGNLIQAPGIFCGDGGDGNAFVDGISF